MIEAKKLHDLTQLHYSSEKPRGVQVYDDLPTFSLEKTHGGRIPCPLGE
jgi:hypothetical protein